MLRDLIKRAILLEEVGEAVNEMKSGKASGLDGFPGKERVTNVNVATLEVLVC